MSKRENTLVVYYDGACPDCVEDRRRYERMAGEGARDLEWLDIAGRDEELIRQGIDPDQALRELHVKDSSGHIHRELDAYRLLMRRVPRLKPLGWLIGLPVIRPVVSWVYRTMVDRRLRRTGRG